MGYRALVGLILVFGICSCSGGCGSDGEATSADVASDGVDAREDVDEGTGADAGQDGEVGGEQTCWSCHGRADHPSPPPDLSGSVDPADPGVGAHEAHLGESNWRAPMRCEHCHPVPDTIDQAGHLDDARPADVVFSGVAALGVEAEWEGQTCRVYCHGAGFHDPTEQSPAWTSTSPLGCTACHGMPPAAPHPDSDRCGDCHLEVADAEGRIVRPWLHINSGLQAPFHAHLVHLGGAGGNFYECVTCHDGRNYHGPLNDGHFIDETTICDRCHPTGSMGAEDWRSYEWPGD